MGIPFRQPLGSYLVGFTHLLFVDGRRWLGFFCEKKLPQLGANALFSMKVSALSPNFHLLRNPAQININFHCSRKQGRRHFSSTGTAVQAAPVGTAIARSVPKFPGLIPYALATLHSASAHRRY